MVHPHIGCSIMSVSTRSSRRRLSYGSDQADEHSSPAAVCALCQLNHTHVSQVCTWQNTQARDVVAEYGITQDDVVCRPCRDDVRRVMTNPSHSPRWEKVKHDAIKCCVKDCPGTCFVHSKINTVKQVFEDTGLQTEGDTIPFPTPLCNHHYYMVYNALQPQQTNCPTCGISLKHIKSRPCPNVELIEKHLRDSAGFDGNLRSGDKVCYSCYKWHLVILQEEKQISRDSDLHSMLQVFRQKISTADQPSTSQQVCDLAMDKTVVYVGEELLQGKAILLPAAHDYFLEQCDEIHATPLTYKLPRQKQKLLPYGC